MDLQNYILKQHKNIQLYFCKSVIRHWIVSMHLVLLWRPIFLADFEMFCTFFHGFQSISISNRGPQVWTRKSKIEIHFDHFRTMIKKTFLSELHFVFSTFWDECDVQIDTFPRNKLSSNCSLIITGLLVTLRESFDSISGLSHVTGQTVPFSAQVLKCLSCQASMDRLGRNNSKLIQIKPSVDPLPKWWTWFNPTPRPTATRITMVTTITMKHILPDSRGQISSSSRNSIATSGLS